MILYLKIDLLKKYKLNNFDINDFINRYKKILIIYIVKKYLESNDNNFLDNDIKNSLKLLIGEKDIFNWNKRDDKILDNLRNNRNKVVRIFHR